jgi:hypothetical protein
MFEKANLFGANPRARLVSTTTTTVPEKFIRIRRRLRLALEEILVPGDRLLERLLERVVR